MGGDKLHARGRRKGKIKTETRHKVELDDPERLSYIWATSQRGSPRPFAFLTAVGRQSYTDSLYFLLMSHAARHTDGVLFDGFLSKRKRGVGITRQQHDYIPVPVVHLSSHALHAKSCGGLFYISAFSLPPPPKKRFMTLNAATKDVKNGEKKLKDRNPLQISYRCVISDNVPRPTR